MHAHERLVGRLLESHPDDAARILEDLPTTVRASALADGPPRVVAEVLRRMAPADAGECLGAMDAARASAILGEMPLDAAAAVLRPLKGDERERLLSGLREDAAERLSRLLRHPDGSAGALMDPAILAVPEDLTAGEALERVRRSAGFAFFYLYVLDRERRLAGVLNLRELMLAAPDDLLSVRMTKSVSAIRADADRMQVLAHPAWRRLHALPVVDDQSRYLGVIRYSTLRRLEAEDQASGGAGASPIETAASLGELCSIGFAGMLAGLVSAVTPARPDRDALPGASAVPGPRGGRDGS